MQGESTCIDTVENKGGVPQKYSTSDTRITATILLMHKQRRDKDNTNRHANAEGRVMRQ